uniref:Large ribosomal subunit protein mL46 n=1 Tax=Podarcis muralis TaxID=64176 RepID=A0A670JYM3_PODMU
MFLPRHRLDPTRRAPRSSGRAVGAELQRKALLAVIGDSKMAAPSIRTEPLLTTNPKMAAPRPGESVGGETYGAQASTMVEMEKSLYSDHELRRFAEEERLRRKKDDDDTEQEIVLIQDVEDLWEQKFRKFNPAPRITEADKKNDRTSLNRKLDQNLLLLVKQKLGDQDIWLLPQTEWQEGETLRATAERALASLSGTHMEAKFLGNAPCGFYKYKFPKAAQTEDGTGAKVFFFKALLQGSHLPLANEKVDHVWVSKGELADYLKPKYHSQVARFLVDL